jgi:hypothetical protein
MSDFGSLEFWRRGGASLFESELRARAATSAVEEVAALTRWVLGQDALPVLRGLLAEHETAEGEAFAALDDAQGARDAVEAELDAVSDRFSAEVALARCCQRVKSVPRTPK